MKTPNLNFEWEHCQVLNKKALQQVSLKSTIGNEVSKIFEDDHVSVLSVFIGDSREVACHSSQWKRVKSSPSQLVP